jgi:CheY-like chemotaxis protein
MTLMELKPYTKNLRLLIVEDDEQIRMATVAVFKRLFAEVDEASDGEEGLMKFQSQPDRYDIILTDINMPNMDGTQMIEAIRKSDALIPIVVLSAHTESDRLIKVINAGADSFLLKPLDTKTQIDSFYRLSVRIGDTKMMGKYINRLEEENFLLTKDTEPSSKYESLPKTSLNEEVVTLTTASNCLEPVVTSISIEETVCEIDNSEYYISLVQEDVHELIDLISDIEDYVLLISQKTALQESDIDKLATSFQKFGSILYRYPLFWPLALTLFTLASGITGKSEIFVAKQHIIAPFLANLIFTLQKYVEDVWKHRAKNPNFYDASLINDIEMFIGIISEETKPIVNNANDLLEFF